MTPAQLATLKTEITTNPLGITPAYSTMGDEAAADRINVIDRPADGSVNGMLNYLLVNKSRDNTGTDTVATSMLGRLILASQTAVAANPFGATGGAMTLDTKCSALAMLEIVRNPNVTTLPYQKSTLQQLLDDMVTAKVMKAADKAAIIALSNNLQSRASELGLPRVTASDIADAKRA